MAKGKPWDSLLKQLIHVNPDSFVQWILPGAIFVKEQPQELESQTREVDALLEVIVEEQHSLLHIEFQTYRDATMANRLQLYNLLIENTYKLPVLSCAIYLLKDGANPQSPLIKMFPGEKKIHEFHFENIEMGNLSAEDILDLNIVTLIPLIPLTQNGTSRDILIQMFTELKERSEASGLEVQLPDLEVISYTLASLVLQRKNTLDLEWLVRRFREMHEIIRDTPIYQEILREGREEGREEGSLNASKRILLLVTQIRFPVLASLAEEVANLIRDEAVFEDIIGKITASKSEDEADSNLRALYHKLHS